MALHSLYEIHPCSQDHSLDYTFCVFQLRLVLQWLMSFFIRLILWIFSSMYFPARLVLQWLMSFFANLWTLHSSVPSYAGTSMTDVIFTLHHSPHTLQLANSLGKFYGVVILQSSTARRLTLYNINVWLMIKLASAPFSNPTLPLYSQLICHLLFTNKTTTFILENPNVANILFS